jgi:hypothetical protein
MNFRMKNTGKSITTGVLSPSPKINKSTKDCKTQDASAL